MSDRYTPMDHPLSNTPISENDTSRPPVVLEKWHRDTYPLRTIPGRDTMVEEGTTTPGGNDTPITYKVDE